MYVCIYAHAYSNTYSYIIIPFCHTQDNGEKSKPGVNTIHIDDDDDDGDDDNSNNNRIRIVQA